MKKYSAHINTDAQNNWQQETPKNAKPKVTVIQKGLATERVKF